MKQSILTTLSVLLISFTASAETFQALEAQFEAATPVDSKMAYEVLRTMKGVNLNCFSWKNPETKLLGQVYDDFFGTDPRPTSMRFSVKNGIMTVNDKPVAVDENGHVVLITNPIRSFRTREITTLLRQAGTRLYFGDYGSSMLGTHVSERKLDTVMYCNVP